MKSTFKRVVALLSLFMIIFTLAGCQTPNEGLDNARKKHAYYTDDSFEKIRFDGKTYVKYDKDVPFSVFDAGRAYLTTKNVPAFMAEIEGISIKYNKEKTLLAVSDFTDDSEMVFVKDGFEGEFEAIIQSGLTEYYCTLDLTGRKTLEVADSAKKEAIEKALTGEPIMRENAPEGLTHASGYLKVDSDFTLFTQAFSVYKGYDGYYIDASYGLYKVPEAYSSLFDFEYEKNYFDYKDFEEYYGGTDL